MVEIIRGQRGMGKYYLCSGQNCIEGSQPIFNDTVIAPQEIVNHIKNQRVMVAKEATKTQSKEESEPVTPSNNLSQLDRAKCIVEEKRISFDPNLHTFTVIGSEGRPQAVKLFPKEICMCPATNTCYHILAAKLSIGLESTLSSSKQTLNLTQLRRNARSCKEKRSGRKCARPGGYSVEPAPDALVDNSQPNNRSALSQIQNQPTQSTEGSQQKFDDRGCKKRSLPRANQPSSSKRACLQQNLNQKMSDRTLSICNQTSLSASKDSMISNMTETQTRCISENQTAKPKTSGSNHLELKNVLPTVNLQMKIPK